jgi:apolipoprotein N-acyltransferase
LSLLSGILLTAAWPEKGFAPLLFVAWVPLLAAEDSFKKYSGMKMFGLALLSFLTWNIATTWWVYFASKEGAYLAIGLNSLFMAVVFTCFHYTKNVLGVSRGYIALVLYWIAFEYMHLNWDVSWPWLTLGNGFAAFHRWIQWYEYTGVFGGSLWILAINIFLYRFLLNLFSGGKKYLVPQGAAIVLFVALPVIFSLYRYNSYTEKNDPVAVTVLQPNVDPYHEKYDKPGHEQLMELLELARSGCIVRKKKNQKRPVPTGKPKCITMLITRPFRWMRQEKFNSITNRNLFPALKKSPTLPSSGFSNNMPLTWAERQEAWVRRKSAPFSGVQREARRPLR